MARYGVNVPASGLPNLTLGLEHEPTPIWGLKESTADRTRAETGMTIRDGLKAMATGDLVYLVTGGAGRASLEAWSSPGRILDRVVVGVVEDTHFIDTTEVWPDDVYPERFTFSVQTDEKQVPAASLPLGVLAAVQYSAAQRGCVVPESTTAATTAPLTPATTYTPDPLVDFEGAISKTVQAKVRREQGKLRSYLLGQEPRGICALCGRTFGSSMLVAAHIKRRSTCSDSEALDTAVVMLNCLAGCDGLYEQGLIGVDNSGIVVAGSNGSPTNDEQALIDALVGRAVAAPDASAGYFAWHFEHVANVP